MNRAAFLSLLAGAAIVGLTIPRLWQTSSHSPSPDAPVKKHVLILGDSIAIGYILGDFVSTGYAPIVQTMMADTATVLWPVSADGKPENCQGTKSGVQHIDRWWQTGGGKWDVIHFNWGLHDLKHESADGKPSGLETDPVQSTVEAYEKQLRELVAKLKTTGAKLVFATSTPVPEGRLKPFRSDADVVRYNQAAVRVMQEHQIAVNDLYAFIKPKMAEWQLPSNVHFNPEGCKALAQKVAGAIGSALKQSSDHDVE